MIDCGKVAFASRDLRGEQFAELIDPDLYGSQVGLLWEDPEYLAAEGLVW